MIAGERPLAEIEGHHREARTAGEEIGGAKGGLEGARRTSPTAGAGAHARRHGRGGIERVGGTTSATWPPAAVARASKARSRLLPPEDRGPTISLSLPAGKALSKRSIPRGSHPGGGKDSTEIAM